LQDARRPGRILLFLIGGGSAATINLVLVYIGVEFLGLRSDLQQNYVNIFAMEISLVYSFVVYRTLVWRDRTAGAARILLRQLPLYHLSAGAGVLARIAAFPLLQSLGIHYLPNTIVGILIGSAVNYALSNRYVFADSAGGERP
jgi:dolichol-phosphate mannosyltransferase